MEDTHEDTLVTTSAKGADDMSPTDSLLKQITNDMGAVSSSSTAMNNAENCDVAPKAPPLPTLSESAPEQKDATPVDLPADEVASDLAAALGVCADLFCQLMKRLR